ncbi:hypothetical protein HYFRA_00013082 [Hymenoscyphus fraxineus]|uniref:BTB domain-containing protein n=1 Tax=Hymenoscyphus fraxineus TaxID=746836 RepID=A0A9N9L879_9HELO|nr:hypothetical protein HYFRA_00013082 [Hymenoscyphus fraxineus]
MPPATKKVKVSHPIVLGTVSGVPTSPDMKIDVFEAEFHVHSHALKLYSAYFQKFLDPPNKPPRPEAPCGAFKYNWVTVVDEGGSSWYLSDSSAFPDGPPATTDFTGEKTQEMEAFAKLLSAIYGEPYHLRDVDQFAELTNLAEYYLALPAVSRSLDGLFHRCPEFTELVEFESLRLLPLAAKLKHAVLFKDCVLFLAAPYEDPVFDRLEDSELKQIVKVAHQRLVETAERLIWNIFIARHTGEDEDQNDVRKCLDRVFPNLDGWSTGNYGKVDFLRHMEQEPLPHTPELTSSFHEDLYAIVQNNSILVRGIEIKDLDALEDDRQKQNLYSAKIEDKDLPWVVKESSGEQA